jgi:hypothetical protein
MVFASTRLDSPLAIAITLPSQSSLLSDGLGVNTANRSVAFIDTQLADYQLLTQGLQAGTAVYALDPLQNEISQITQVLAGYQDLSQVAIFSHGRAGAVQLGNLTLDSSDLGFYSQDLQVWGQALAANASLALYGCEVAAGEVGQAFVNQLQGWLGANVAASTDLTGSAALNGNWTLEYATGAAPVSVLQAWAEGYNHVLATFAVSNTDDSGEGSLRDAVAAANALTTEANTIVFQLAGDEPQTITLTSGQLQVMRGELAIQGPGADWLTISGNDASRVFQIDAGATVTLAQLTVANGRIETAISTDLGGGGILNQGTLTLLNSTVTNNVATTTAPAVVSAIPTSTGGGIYNTGTLHVVNSRVTDNQVIATIAGTATYADALGGGIYTTGKLTVDNSFVEGNRASGAIAPPVSNSYTYTPIGGGRGAGIYTASGSPTITNSQFTGNSAALGGALFGSATIDNSQFINNRASRFGGAIYVSFGNVMASNSQFVNNSVVVAAVVARLGPGPTLRGGVLTVTNSQFSGSTILNVGNTTVTNSQFSGNNGGILNTSDMAQGMATYVSGIATVNNSQFIGNRVGIGNSARLTVDGSQFIRSFISRSYVLAFVTGAFTTVKNSQFIGGGINDLPPIFGQLSPPLTVINSQFIDG